LVVAAVVGAVLLAATTAGAAEGAREQKVLVIGHRGASADAPEHTIAAYDRAVEQGADVLECDLQLTADEVPVCVHDTTVDRTTGGTAQGRVEDFTLEQLQAMDFGSWFGPDFAGAQIVTLEEQLRCYGGLDGIQFYVETKAPAEYQGRMEPILVDLLREHDLVPRGREAEVERSPVIVQSFDLSSLQAVKRLAPSLPTAWLWAAPPPELDAGTIPPGVDVMAPNAAFLAGQPGFVANSHAAGQDVHTWTVDDPAQIQQLVDLGVDGIFTNRPGVAREIVDRAQGSEPPRRAGFRRGCPAPADPAARTAAPAATAASDDSDGSSTPVLAIVIATAVVVALMGIVWWFVRRRTAGSGPA
jgi:glycerophosphoryl diester phosphodiesterase